MNQLQAVGWLQVWEGGARSGGVRGEQKTGRMNRLEKGQGEKKMGGKEGGSWCSAECQFCGRL